MASQIDHKKLRCQTVNIMQYIRLIFYIFLSFFLNACTVITYELRNKLAQIENSAPCEIIFTLNLQSIYSTNSFGEQSHEIEKIKKIKENYVSNTLNTLTNLDCSAKQTANITESNFSINVSRQLQLSALPQEWLTGLSFGLILSWGTKYAQYVFTFSHHDSGASYSYTIDQNHYSHLMLFPVSWITFFTADEHSAYTKALKNFMKSF